LTPASRFLSSTGVRLALLQAILLVVVFSAAGALTKVSVKFIYRDELRTHILGEVAALAAADRSGGLGAVIRIIAQSEHRPGGLDYRLTDARGRALAGDLPATGAGPGFTYLDWDDKAEPGRPFADLMVYTVTLPDRAVLTVGQDLGEESKLRHALKRTLLGCEAIGGALGLGLTFLLAFGTLRRVQGVVTAARAVSSGQMQIRAPQRKAWLADDIDELGAAFNSMLDEISTLMTRVRWVSTDIAHDLRTPLTRIRHKLDAIHRSADARAAEAAGEIEADIDELLRTFDAMLRLAEIENGPGATPAEKIDLAELVGRVADAYRPDIEASGRTLELAIEPAQAWGEPDLIAQAVSNLLENALRHTPVHTCIKLRVETADGRPRISVVDDGPGVPAAQRQAVLQRFHRLPTNRAAGSGLGLAIAAAIAQRHGGALTLSDAAPGLRAELRLAKPPRQSSAADGSESAG
jgi:signal transduction histidine kinase